MTRVDRFTIQHKLPVYYRTLKSSFDTNPTTGLLSIVTNEQAVKQSITNLVLTNIYERYEQPYIGSKLQSMLFEPMDSMTEGLIKDTIIETITNCEPRCELVGVQVKANDSIDAYDVTVIFTLINIPEQITLNLVLQRIR